MFRNRLAEKMEALLTEEKQRGADALLSLRSDYEARLRDKDSMIEDYRVRHAAAEAECERMRLVMMPHSSQIGAAYARSKAVEQQHKKTMVPVSDRVPATDWPTQLRQEVEKLEAEGEKESANKSTEKET